MAASHFLNIYFINIQKGENRHFSQSEQYGRLESGQAAKLPVQAARSRAQTAYPAVWIQGYQGCPRWPKAAK